MTIADAKPENRSTDDPFPRDKFVTKPGVIVFAEHSTRLRDGTPVTYDRDALERIAGNCNRRIEETGNYAAVCIGHTNHVAPSARNFPGAVPISGWIRCWRNRIPAGPLAGIFSILNILATPLGGIRIRSGGV
ncbi:MAG: hypothetical protein Kow0040_07860 [Thermogutta sp.]